MKYNYINHSAAVFCGFYESPLYHSDSIYNATYNHTAPDGYEFDMTDFKGFENEVAHEYTNLMYENLPSENEVIKDMKFITIHSPRFYNYETDKLEIEVDFDENKLVQYAMENDFASWLKENYTSRSGFISFVPTDLDEFMQSEYKWDVLLEFYFLKEVDFESLEYDIVPFADQCIYDRLCFYKDGKYFEAEYDSESDEYKVRKED